MLVTTSIVDTLISTGPLYKNKSIFKCRTDRHFTKLNVSIKTVFDCCYIVTRGMVNICIGSCHNVIHDSTVTCTLTGFVLKSSFHLFDDRIHFNSGLVHIGRVDNMSVSRQKNKWFKFPDVLVCLSARHLIRIASLDSAVK